LLLLIGIGASLLYSIWSVVRGNGHVYLEVGVMVLVLVTLGRWLEAEGKLQTTRSLRELASLLPQSVRRLRPHGIESVELSLVETGDQIRILPGERIPVDGRILRGRATVDEQTVTGESMPIEKDPGQLVYSGTFNLNGEIVVIATAVGGAGTLQRLLDTVLEAASHRNRYQRLADRIAAWLLPLVAAAAFATFLGHCWWQSEAPGWIALERPLLSSLAVIVIACPCALGLATPMAFAAAIGRAASEQVLFREGDALSRLASARLVCFDKTGTLTTGQLTVVGSWTAPAINRQTIKHVAAALANRSTHPVSATIAQALQADGALISLEGFSESPGRGLKAWAPALDAEIVLGSWQYVIEMGCGAEEWNDCPEADQWQHHVLCFLAIGGRVVAVFALDESLRPEAKAAVDALRSLGLSLRLLSGDRQPRAAYIAGQLGLEYEAELLPTAKFHRIRELMKLHGPVVMVGDGLNDAPALAAADVGIALGCGADLSRDAAGICILSNRLDRIPWTIQLARQAHHTLRWNLLWAFGYNLAAVPLAMLGVVNPIVAALAMAASSLLVVANSLKLARSDAQLPPAIPDEEPHISTSANQEVCPTLPS
jgi:heavy metal translocating P-type ATPase